jgi:CopG family nickel-responsive transcriptional regulator
MSKAPERPQPRGDDSAGLVRFGVSMDAELLEAFDRLIGKKGYANRSEAIRDLVREKLVELEWQGGRQQTAGAVCLVYDHHVLELPGRLTHVQHEYGRCIVSSLHVHLDDHNCFEILALRGPAGRLRRIADRLISMRGVKYGKLIMATEGRELA